MGFLDTLLGRTKPVQPKLDDLFQLPSAAVTLQAATGFIPTGSGSVCFKPVEGKAFSDVEKEIRELLDLDAAKGNALPVEVSKDSFGYIWLSISCMSDEIAELVTDLHAVNSSLVQSDFGPYLIWTIVTFRDDSERRLAIVYLYKRGTFYPYAPVGREGRSNPLELEVRGAIGGELKWETDLTKWVPISTAPGL